MLFGERTALLLPAKNGLAQVFNNLKFVVSITFMLDFAWALIIGTLRGGIGGRRWH